MKKTKFIKKNKLKRILNVYKAICLVLIGLLIFSIKAYADKKPVNTVKVVKQEIVNPNIVMLGDSITDLYDLNEFYGEDKLIVNSGISGNRIHNILDDLKKRVYAYNPSKVFLLIGINDILWDNADDTYVYENTIEIINQIHEKLPNTKIYIESIYPYNDDFRYHYDGEAPDYGRVSSTITSVNAKLHEYSLQYDYIKYIDLYDLLKDENGSFNMAYSDDGLHPNEAGYRVITDLLKKYM